MVWPILISVAVTPRISAAVAGSPSNISAPNPASKRIGFASHVRALGRWPRQARFGRRSLLWRKHAMARPTAPWTTMTSGKKKTAAAPPRFLFKCNPLFRLRLGLEAGVRIGTRARLAGGRHGGGARRARLQHRLAVGVFSVEQVLNLVTAQRLELEQALCQGFEVLALLREDSRGFVVALFDKAPDLGVNLLNRRFRRVLGAGYRHPQEHLVLVFAVGHGAKGFGQTPARYHHARQSRCLLDIGGGPGRNLLPAEDQLFRNAAAHHDGETRGHLLE